MPSPTDEHKPVTDQVNFADLPQTQLANDTQLEYRAGRNLDFADGHYRRQEYRQAARVRAVPGLPGRGLHVRCVVSEGTNKEDLLKPGRQAKPVAANLPVRDQGAAPPIGCLNERRDFATRATQWWLTFEVRRKLQLAAICRLD